MTRIDHDEVAREHLDALSGWGSRDDLTASDILVHGAYAHANAVQALKYVVEDLVEQQRIANLIGLAKVAGREEDVHEGVAEAAYEALNALITTKIVPNGHMDPFEVEVLRPDIAAALGVEAES